MSISKGNSKIGNILNWSLPPRRTCGDVPCYDDCYIWKSWIQYPDVRRSWKQNLVSVQDGTFEQIIIDYLNRKRKPVPVFRIHVGGDFRISDDQEECQAYIDGWIRIAQAFPDTRFLAFTKQFDLDYSNTPDNLQIVFSGWPGMEVPCGDLPIAWLQNGKETRVPKDAIECFGSCENCGMCWNLSSLNKDVVFNVH